MRSFYLRWVFPWVRRAALAWFSSASHHRRQAHQAWFGMSAGLVLSGVVVNALSGQVPLDFWVAGALAGLLMEIVFFAWRRHPFGAGIGLAGVCLMGVASVWGWLGPEAEFLSAQDRVGILALVLGTACTMGSIYLFSPCKKSVAIRFIDQAKSHGRELNFPVVANECEKWTCWEWPWFFHAADPLNQALHRERVLDKLPQGEATAAKKRL